MLPEDPSYETVGGFVLTRLGFIPRGGESFEADGYRFTVMEMDHRRVSRLKIKALPPAIVPSPATESAPHAAEVPQAETQAVSTHHGARADVLEMPGPNSAADSPTAKKVRRRATRKKVPKPSDATAVPSPDEPATDSPSSGPAHK